MRSVEKIIEIVTSSKSRYPNFCDGISTSNSETYVLGTILTTGKDTIKFSNDGSQLLDEINAFDIAEKNGPYIGQLNMSTVSSFCGPQGAILGFDLLQSKKLLSAENAYKEYKQNDIAVKSYFIYPLIESTQSILGTLNDKRYPIIPGAHVPFANKSFKCKGPCTIYSAVALGIARNREEDACLLMEDCGYFRSSEDIILNNMCESVLQVGKNQNVDFEIILVGIKKEKVYENEIGCALVAMPYIALASDLINNKLSELTTLTLEEWEFTNYGFRSK